MPLPTKPFSDWTKADVEALVAEPPAVESARLDFKAECKILSTEKNEQDKARKDILKDIAAMVNGGGGALLVGVRQSGKQGDPPMAVKIEGIERDSVERLKQCIGDLVATYLDVRPGPLEYWGVAHENDRVVLIVDIPANTYSLSMVTYGQLNQFWVRRGAENRPMTTDEIQYQFGRARCRGRGVCGHVELEPSKSPATAVRWAGIARPQILARRDGHGSQPQRGD